MYADFLISFVILFDAHLLCPQCGTGSAARQPVLVRISSLFSTLSELAGRLLRLKKDFCHHLADLFKLASAYSRLFAFIVLGIWRCSGW